MMSIVILTQFIKANKEIIFLLHNILYQQNCDLFNIVIYYRCNMSHTAN